jgi:hypothetical protein
MSTDTGDTNIAARLASLKREPAHPDTLLRILLGMYLLNRKAMYVEYMAGFKTVADIWVLSYPGWDASLLKIYPSTNYPAACLNCTTHKPNQYRTVSYHCEKCQGKYQDKSITPYEVQEIAKYLGIHYVQVERILCEIIYHVDTIHRI